MTENQAKALRPYFHGLTDEQFTEMISEWPLNNISKAMDDFALHIAEQAVEEAKNYHFDKIETAWDHGYNQASNEILSRIKQLISE